MAFRQRALGRGFAWEWEAYLRDILHRNRADFDGVAITLRGEWLGPMADPAHPLVFLAWTKSNLLKTSTAAERAERGIAMLPLGQA